MTVSLHPRFMAINYPGYYWDTENKKLYSIKVEGVLKPLTIINPSKFNKLRGPAYRISYKNDPRYVYVDRLMSLKPKDVVIDTKSDSSVIQKKYTIETAPYWFSLEGIKHLENHYNVKHIGYWCIKNKNGSWSESPVDVFWSENPDTSKGHSNFLGIYRLGGDIYLTDAQSAFSEEILGKALPSGNVIVSRYRHDYRENGNIMVDGGRDYFRASTLGETVKVTFEKGEFVFTKV